MLRNRKTTRESPIHMRTKPSPIELIDPAEVGAALGGERVEKVETLPQGPLMLHALRLELSERRRSSGGRPALAGTDRRVKIPLSDEDWSRLAEMAGDMAADNFAPSPGQVAGILLHNAIAGYSAGKSA